MTDIHVTARLKIHDGQRSAFTTVAEECLRCVREKDSGTLRYDWFLNDDGSECVVRERYTHSGAVLEHVGNLGETLGELMGVADMSLEIFGSASAELVAALEGLDVKFYSYYQGL